MSPFFVRAIYRCIGSILQAFLSLFVIPNHVHIIQEPIHSIFLLQCSKSVKILCRFNGPNSLPPRDHSKRTLKHFLIYFFFFFSTTKGSFLLSFSLKGQYKALCNNFLLGQYSVHSFLPEKNESAPKVKKTNIVLKSMVFCCSDCATKLGHKWCPPCMNRTNQIFLRAATTVLILEEVFKYYLYVYHPLTCINVYV